MSKFLQVEVGNLLRATTHLIQFGIVNKEVPQNFESEKLRAKPGY